MTEQKLIDALVARAAVDARAFREKNPDDAPTERWIENSYTAALPLAQDDIGFDPGQGPHPQLFAAYREAIGRAVGERVNRREGGTMTQQQPTAGEN
ncbi:MAG TPA: hypothetical protein VND45_13115 [Thermoanaerobaculia bacterium]|jgi:hypothetical protein|nr:hypothetical protein [Thermoanaerobaculia bacterium]